MLFPLANLSNLGGGGGGAPPCMNDCIAWPTPGPLAPMGLDGPPVPGNSVESKQARRGASSRGGISAFELSFGDKWNVEMEQSVAESPTHTICTSAIIFHNIPYAHFPICVLASKGS